MPLFQWNPSFSVKVKAFDDQHQQLVALVNGLFDAMKEGKGKDVLNGVFSDLIKYTESHFKAEEEMMKKYGYVETESHTAEHNELTKQALELQAKFQNGSLFISIETLNFLKDWLTKHILNTDMHYAKFFNDKGVF